MFPDEEEFEGLTPEEFVSKYQSIQLPSIKALENLDKIDWSMLHHAHGKATDVPALLRAILSSNEEDRGIALDLLHETIWHQGTIYEASAYVVPFLLKALESEETPDKTIVAFLLTSLADGSSGLQVHALQDEQSEKTWREILARDNRILEVEIAKEIEYVNLVRKEVGKGLHLLYPYLKAEETSLSVATILAYYPESKAESLTWLEDALASVSDEYAKEEIQSTMAKLRESNES